MGNEPGQPISIGNIVSQPILQQEFLRWLSDPNEYFIWVQHTIRGEVLMKDSNSKEFWSLPFIFKDSNKPDDKTFLPEQMTEEGAVNITNKLRYYLNQFTFHADYTDDQINDMMLPIAKEMNIYLKRNQKHFHIDDTNISTIAIGIKTLIFTAFKMSRMRDFYTDVLKIGIGQQPEKEKGKLLGIFPKP